MNKTKLVLGIAAVSLTVAGITVSDDAQAKSRKHRHRSVSHSSYQSSSESALMSKVDALEAQLRSMQDEMAAVKAGSAQSADATKVQELDAWMQESRANPAKKVHDNMLFFRGGYAHQSDTRGGTLDPAGGAIHGQIGDVDAWYFGAGFDFGLTDDVWGMMNGTEVFGELLLDYTELGNHALNGLTPVVNAATGLPAANSETATVNMLRIAASPKIKFMKGSSFRPWLIPIGFELNIISPPSDAITVLTPGMQFGLGADYRVWKEIFIGADARYHYAPGNVDGVSTNGLTAGGYVGIGF